jgi:hypothetical protein
MDYNALSQIVTTLGFPIVMCGIMAYFIKYIYDANQKAIDAMDTRHTEEINELRSVIANNTSVMEKLLTKFEVMTNSKVKEE